MGAGKEAILGLRWARNTPLGIAAVLGPGKEAILSLRWTRNTPLRIAAVLGSMEGGYP